MAAGGKLASLIVPGVDAATEAGKLLEELPRLWAGANLSERHKVLATMLEAVYVDAAEPSAVVAIRPKPAFRPLFQVAATREGSGVVLIKEEPPGHDQRAETDPCLWWRRGGVERYLKHNLAVLVAA